eukprot:GHVU01208774.1.p1 GENE.GHVU01208774.1~~GHVU01208774.1.p1  ORF type:complete len:305 (+),score=85.36 GHVU01208774.1:344-1258(+)
MAVAKRISGALAKAAVVAGVKYLDRRPLDAAQPLAAADEGEEEEEAEAKLAAAEEGDAESGFELVDMLAALEGSCHLKIFDFDSEEGRKVFFHSGAHILGQCLETLFGGQLTIGPALKKGFYYDCFMGEHVFKTDYYEKVEKCAKRICEERQPFERLDISKEDALELFKENPFKAALISSKVPEGAATSVYRNGPFVDLCRGPHVANSSQVRAFAVEKNSAAYWLGNKDNDDVQRIYGIAFPDAKGLKKHKEMVAEAAKRDHRTVGTDLSLFFFDSHVSPGSCFWLPDGAKVYNTLCNFLRVSE